MVDCPTEQEEKFSFFMISHDATIRESGSPDGFGGDLGGITGADAICQRVAEYSSPCQSKKVWHAFLSTSKEDAIDRIGKGPWHDRLGRLFANQLSELLNDRPINAAPEIIDDFPNEDGVPNQFPHGEMVDNHQTLTGSGINGRLYDQASGGRSGGGSTACGDGEEWTVEKAKRHQLDLGLERGGLRSGRRTEGRVPDGRDRSECRKLRWVRRLVLLRRDE
jgi:hypothetical protein